MKNSLAYWKEWVYFEVKKFIEWGQRRDSFISDDL